MSVTFEPSSQSYYKVPNEFFEADAPEDAYMNPRLIPEPIYPRANFSNMNTALMLKGVLEEDDFYVGSKTPEELPEFIQKLSNSMDPQRAGHVIRIAQICIANNWNLNWG